MTISWLLQSHTLAHHGRSGRKRPDSFAKPYGLFQASKLAFAVEPGALALALGGRRCQVTSQVP